MWEYNIKTNLKETGWEEVGWMYLIADEHQQQSLRKAATNFRIPYEAGLSIISLCRIRFHVIRLLYISKAIT